MGFPWLKLAESLWQQACQFGEMGLKLKDSRNGVQLATIVPLLPSEEQVIATSAETDVPWLQLILEICLVLRQFKAVGTLK